MQLQRILNRDPFILVLIDGDGLIFNGTFLKQAEPGGKQAAAVLHAAVARWAAENVMECPPDVKVVATVYANLRGLAQVCMMALPERWLTFSALEASTSVGNSANRPYRIRYANKRALFRLQRTWRNLRAASHVASFCSTSLTLELGRIAPMARLEVGRDAVCCRHTKCILT